MKPLQNDLRRHVNGGAQPPVRYENARQETGAVSFRMASGELSERDVIRGAQTGDERMYRELVSRYVRPALASPGSSRTRSMTRRTSSRRRSVES